MYQEPQQALQQLLTAVTKGVVSRALSAVESHPVPLHSAKDRRKGGQFGVLLKRMQPYGHRLACNRANRGAFLWGVANYLKGLPHEELVIGFGIAQGTRTFIESVIKIRGEADSVLLPPDASANIHSFLGKNEKHTVLLVHNHPESSPVLWLMRLLLGDDPLPSITDRDVGLAILGRRLQSKMSGFALGKVRLYVVQNDGILEFSGFTPALLLDAFRKCLSNALQKIETATI